MARDGVFCYEQPLNERIRTFLRLEHLLSRLRYHQADESAWGRRAAMAALMDVLNVMSRYDTRAEVSKELGQRYAGLERLADRDDIDSGALARILDELDALGRDIQRIPPQFASYQIRDNELLSSLDNRLAIPGGSCSFDLPAYQHWLAQGVDRTGADIKRWCQRIVPFEQAVNQVLRLLRDSTSPREMTAETGMLVHHTEPGTQMIRLLLDHASVYPEISAGPHRATVRFMEYADDKMRVRQSQSPITFRLASCRL